MKKHPWNVSLEEAYNIQEALKHSIIIDEDNCLITSVAGIDICYEKGSRRACCVIAVFSFPQLRFLGYAHAEDEISFPYLPGIFAFREGPLVEKAFLNISLKPDIYLFDGQGICHPRGIGIASHMGVYLDIATIGCAKSYLSGIYTMPGRDKGNKSPILINETLAGYALRTKDNTRPIFVSPGHKTGFRLSIDISLTCTTGYRIPEPIRQAHILSRKLISQSIIL
jgi:deoxyribonuclease V